MRYLDNGHASRVERVHGGADLGLGELMRHRVATITQGRVGDPQLALCSLGAGARAGKRRRHAVTAPVVGSTVG